MSKTKQLLVGFVACLVVLVGAGLATQATTQPGFTWPSPDTSHSGFACKYDGDRTEGTATIKNNESGYKDDPARVSNVMVVGDPTDVRIPITLDFVPNPIPNPGTASVTFNIPADYAGTVKIAYHLDWKGDKGYDVKYSIPVVKCLPPVTTTTTAVTTTSTSTTIPTTTTTAPSTTTTTRPTTTTTQPTTTTSTSTTSTSTTSTTQPSTTTTSTTEPETTTTTSTIPETTTTTQPDGSTTTTSTVVTSTSSTTTPVPPTTTPEQPTTTVTDLSCEEAAKNEGRPTESCTTVTSLPVTGTNTTQMVGYSMIILGVGFGLCFAAWLLNQRRRTA